MFRIFKYLQYLQLLADLSNVISQAKLGREFSLAGTYRVENKIVDIVISGQPRYL